MREDHTSAMLRLYREPSSGRLAWYSRDFMSWKRLGISKFRYVFKEHARVNF